jgi:urease gamma subunit
MIHVKATVRGEPDAPVFAKVFDYDEEIFFSSAELVGEKIKSGLKVNASETLMLFCAYVVKSIRAGRQDSNIQDEARKILSVEQVMIGVPETLRVITFEAAIDSRPARKIVLNQPIPAGKYTLVG